MKSLLTIAFILFTFITPNLALADWATDLVTDPLVEVPVPAVPTSIRSNREYFYYIPATSTLDSSWIFLSSGMNVDVCFNPNVGAHSSTSTWTMSISTVPHSFPNSTNRPTGADNLSSPLLGKVLTGGSGNDCIFDIKGPMYLSIDVLTTGATPGLVSLTYRGY